MPTVFNRDGDDIRKIRDIFVNDGGTIRKVRKAFTLDAEGNVQRIHDGIHRYSINGVNGLGTPEIQDLTYGPNSTRSNVFVPQANEVSRIALSTGFNSGATQNERLRIAVSSLFNGGTAAGFTGTLGPTGSTYTPLQSHTFNRLEFYTPDRAREVTDDLLGVRDYVTLPAGAEITVMGLVQRDANSDIWNPLFTALNGMTLTTNQGHSITFTYNTTTQALSTDIALGAESGGTIFELSVNGLSSFDNPELRAPGSATSSFRSYLNFQQAGFSLGEINSSVTIDPDRNHAVYRGTAFAEPSTTTNDYWGYFSDTVRDAAADGTFPTSTVFYSVIRLTSDTGPITSGTITWFQGSETHSENGVRFTNITSTSGYRASDGNLYFIDPNTQLSDAFHTVVSGNVTIYYFAIRRTGFNNIEFTTRFQDNQNATQALTTVGNGVAALDPAITWDGNIDTATGSGMSVTYDMSESALTFPFTTSGTTTLSAPGRAAVRSVADDSLQHNDSSSRLRFTLPTGTYSSMAEFINSLVLNIDSSVATVTRDTSAETITIVSTTNYLSTTAVQNAGILINIDSNGSWTIRQRGTFGSRDETSITIDLGTTTDLTSVITTDLRAADSSTGFGRENIRNELTASWSFDPDVFNAVYRGAATAEPSATTNDYWGRFGTDTVAADDTSVPTSNTFARSFVQMAEDATSFSIFWENTFVGVLSRTGLESSTGALGIDGNRYFIDFTSGPFSEVTNFPPNPPSRYYAIRRTGFANLTAGASFADNQNSTQALTAIGNAIAALDPAITWDGNITDVAATTLNITQDLTGLSYPIIVPTNNFDHQVDLTGITDTREGVSFGGFFVDLTPGTYNDAISLAAEIVSSSASAIAFVNGRLSSGAIFTVTDNGDGTITYGGTNVYNVSAIGYIFQGITQGTITGTNGNRAEQYIDVDLGTMTPISQSLTITANSGTSTLPLLTEFAGNIGAGTVASSYLVEDYANREVTMFTAMVANRTTSDVGVINARIVSAVNTNIEVPTDFMAVDDTTNNRIRLTAETGEVVTGTWRVIAMHPGGGDDAGNIQYAQSTIQEGAESSGVSVNVDGNITVVLGPSEADADTFGALMADELPATYDAATDTLEFEDDISEVTFLVIEPNSSTPLKFTYY